MNAATAPNYFAVLRDLFGNRSFMLCCVGMTAATFVLGGVAAWVPSYVFQREGRFELTAKVLDEALTFARPVGACEFLSLPSACWSWPCSRWARCSGT